MKTPRHIALDYLRPPAGAPWRWEDNGRALVWSDGATIAFREELLAVFERLSPGQLPPFPVLVCILAACRGRYLQPSAPAAAAPTGLSAVLNRRAEQLALDSLRKLAALPAELIGTPRAKATLAQIVFEADKRGGGPMSEAAQVVKGMEAPFGDAELNSASSKPGEPPLDVVATLHAAGHALRAHTPESLRLRLRTGLDALPGAKMVQISLPRSERAKRLLAKLAADEEQGGLARVAGDLMAAIRLPSALARADEQAAGGASGLGNRGSLDRLLLSELAHDDLTLATRVALNEALYLHREPPARRPRRGLALLLDAGLRMWGVPRLLGTAAALALLGGWPDEAEAQTWRADDTNPGPVPVDLLDEAALTTHLAKLGVALDPRQALPGFLARVEAAGETDLVLVTHRQTLRAETFRRQLAQLDRERAYVVLVDASGLVQLHALPWPGEHARPLAETRVDLTKLHPAKRVGTEPASPSPPPPVNPAASLDLPAIFRVSPFPLLLPVTGKLDRTAEWGEGGLCVTEDRRLLHWSAAGLGARQIAADMPGGRTAWLDGRPDGGITLVRGRDRSGKMAVLGFANTSAPMMTTRLTGPHHPMGVHMDHTAILLILHTRAAAVALDASTLLGETPMPQHLRAIGGRYAIDRKDLWFASWDGSQVRWDKTEIGRHAPVGEIVCAFQREGAGPWVVLRDGRVLAPAGNEWMRLDLEPALVTPLRHGAELLILTAGKTPTRQRVDLKTKVSKKIAADKIAADPATLLAPPSRQLLSRIEAIHAVPGQPLRLRSAKGRWLEVFAQRDGLRLVQAAGKAATLDAEACLFASISISPALGCTLKRARWPNGSTAWLDDRGLLHLRSRNVDVPEISLVLGRGIPLAGWTSDGRTFGPRFFTGKQDDPATDHVLSALARFSNAVC